ncbi:MAG TPA: sigma 54-interacting transcriptional regulator [Polyangiaceae bacterium]|nr:sigma 54-interacting transcriptional regulator [Polyangiaceae bacterium]
MIRLEVRAGSPEAAAFELDQDVVRIGRDAANDVVLAGPHVSPQHARLVAASTGVILEDLRSERGTARIREGERTVADEANRFRLTLRSGDLIEFGSGEAATVLAVSTGEVVREAQVMALRRIDDLKPAAIRALRDPERLGQLYALQRQIGLPQSLDEVLVALGDAALELVPLATHATVVLRDEGSDAHGGDAGSYVPVLTRVRNAASGSGDAPGGAVPVARSVFRKVVAERAAVLAADAPKEVSGSDSLLGASIRSTIGVPLFHGDELLGVLQVDNRTAPAMLNAGDVEVLAVLCASASLAVANVRLIERLRVAEARLQKENSYLKNREAARRGGVKEVIGKSRVMTALLAQVDRVADTRVSVLVEGETGTGKELIASAVHYRSKRADKLFVTQNCAALPDNLLESELFGHKKGSFTGATEEKKGLFEIADGGTLFLDEVGEMPLGLQAKLLRVLQEGEVRPIGALHPRHVDVRIVAATNRNLEEEVRAGRFREDLFYRLRVFPVRVPPLRERREDVALLATHFLARYAREMGKPTGNFAQATLEVMAAYDWPGNVRELQNEVQRLVIQVDPGGIVTPDLLSPHVRKIEGLIARAGVTRGTLKDMSESVEKFFILEVLREHGNNKTNAAKSLGITREGLHKKLRQFGIG